MIALYIIGSLFAVLAYGGMAGLTSTLWAWLEIDDGRPATSPAFAGVFWPVMLPLLLMIAMGYWVAGRLGAWRDARRLPKAQVFRG